MYFVEKIKALLQSRRFWAAICAAIVTTVGEELGFDEDQIQWLVTIIVGWIVGDSLSNTSSPRLESVRRNLGS